VPPLKPTKLTRREVAELRAADRAIHDARLAWAITVRRLGIAACARELGVTPQALGQRLGTVERFTRETEGRVGKVRRHRSADQRR